SDRHSLPWLMPAGLLLAGAGLAAAGLVHPYGLTFAAITVSGLGVAAYHPEASRYANYVSGRRHATGMSLFSVGGNAGFALGRLPFVPLYYVGTLHTSKATGNLALTAMLVAGAVGTLVGGRLADRIGTRPIFIASLAALTPLIALFLAVGPAPGMVVLAAIGGLTIATFSVTVVMGQRFLPGRGGVASGVALGLSVGGGGPPASAVGAGAGRWGR